MDINKQLFRIYKSVHNRWPGYVYPKAVRAQNSNKFLLKWAMREGEYIRKQLHWLPVISVASLLLLFLDFKSGCTAIPDRFFILFRISTFILFTATYLISKSKLAIQYYSFGLLKLLVAVSGVVFYHFQALYCFQCQKINPIFPIFVIVVTCLILRIGKITSLAIVALTLVPSLIESFIFNTIPFGDEFSYLMLGLCGILYSSTRVETDTRFYVSEKVFNDSLKKKNDELKSALDQLNIAQLKVIQSSQMAEVGQLSATFAHEINSPLIGVSWSVKSLEGVIQGGTFGAVEVGYISEDLGKIKEGLRLISETILNIQTASGNPNTRASIESLSEIIRVAVGMTGHTFKGKAEIKVIGNTEAKAFLQKVKTIRCLVNLITNAVYAMDEANTKAAKVELVVEEDLESVLLSVKDNGPGIPAHIQQNIFKPFNTSKKAGSGTGLGLSMVKNMMEEMMGSISYRTSEAGTIFVLRFRKLEVV